MGKFVNKTALVYNILPNKNAFAISEDDEAIFIHANALERANYSNIGFKFTSV